MCPVEDVRAQRQLSLLSEHLGAWNPDHGQHQTDLSPCGIRSSQNTEQPFIQRATEVASWLGPTPVEYEGTDGCTYGAEGVLCAGKPPLGCSDEDPGRERCFPVEPEAVSQEAASRCDESLKAFSGGNW